MKELHALSQVLFGSLLFIFLLSAFFLSRNNLWSQELANAVKEPIGVTYFDNLNNSNPLSTAPQNGWRASTDEGRFSFSAERLGAVLLPNLFV